jgi:hypothetical protein
MILKTPFHFVQKPHVEGQKSSHFGGRTSLSTRPAVIRRGIIVDISFCCALCDTFGFTAEASPPHKAIQVCMPRSAKMMARSAALMRANRRLSTRTKIRHTRRRITWRPCCTQKCREYRHECQRPLVRRWTFLSVPGYDRLTLRSYILLLSVPSTSSSSSPSSLLLHEPLIFFSPETDSTTRDDVKLYSHTKLLEWALATAIVVPCTAIWRMVVQ